MANTPPGIKQIDWFQGAEWTNPWANPTPYMRRSSAEGTIDPGSQQAAFMAAQQRLQQQQYEEAVKAQMAPYTARYVGSAGTVPGHWENPNSSTNQGPPMPGMSRSGSSHDLPGYGDGTDSAAPGPHVVGEKGPEVVNFRGGEQVYPNQSGRYGAGAVGGKKRDRLNGRHPQDIYNEGMMAGQINHATGVEMHPSATGRPEVTGYHPIPPKTPPPYDMPGRAGLLPPSAPPGQQVSPEAYQAYYGPGGAGGWMNPATNQWEARTSMPGAGPLMGGAPAPGGGAMMYGQGQHLAFTDAQSVQHHYQEISGMYYPTDAQGNIAGSPIPTVQFRQAMGELYGVDPFTGERTMAQKAQDFNQQQQIISRFGYSGAPTPMNFERNRAQANSMATLYDPQAQADYQTGRDYILNNSPYASQFERGEDVGSHTDPQYAAMLRTQAIRRANGLPY